jgi:hypothetical protein
MLHWLTFHQLGHDLASLLCETITFYYIETENKKHTQAQYHPTAK